MCYVLSKKWPMLAVPLPSKFHQPATFSYKGRAQATTSLMLLSIHSLLHSVDDSAPSLCQLMCAVTGDMKISRIEFPPSKGVQSPVGEMDMWPRS